MVNRSGDPTVAVPADQHQLINEQTERAEIVPHHSHPSGGLLLGCQRGGERDEEEEEDGGTSVIGRGTDEL